MGLALGLGACAPDLDLGRLEGELCAQDCPAGAPPSGCAVLDWPIEDASLERIGERVQIRLAQSARSLAQADALILDLRAPQAVAQQLGVAIPLSDTGPLRAALTFFERCPDAQPSLGLRGAVRFEAFGTRKGDRVAGSLEGVQIYDRRQPEAPAIGHLEGRFSFQVSYGGRHQAFTQF